MKCAKPEDFEHWLFSMDQTLEWLLQSLPPDDARQLDYGPESLVSIEEMILQRYPNTESMLKPEESEWVNAFACYIGETFRRKNGSQWSIRQDDPKFAFHGLPILAGGFKQTTPLCPMALATATADRRTGKYLRTILENLKANNIL